MARCPGRPVPGLSALLALAMPPPPPPGQAWAAPCSEGGTQSPGPVGGRRRKGRPASTGCIWGGFGSPLFFATGIQAFAPERAQPGSRCARGLCLATWLIAYSLQFLFFCAGFGVGGFSFRNSCSCFIALRCQPSQELGQIPWDLLFRTSGPPQQDLGAQALSVPCGEGSAMNLPGLLRDGSQTSSILPQFRGYCLSTD